MGENSKKVFKSQYKIHQFKPSFSIILLEIESIWSLASILTTSLSLDKDSIIWVWDFL